VRLWKGVAYMADYKEMYYQIFNKLTDIMEEIKNVQLEMEELFIKSESDEEK